MDITGDYTFDAPREIVWAALQDPIVLGSVMPGGKGFEQVADNQFKGALQIKVGPVQGDFQGQIQLSDVKPPESYQIQVDGKGAPGFVKATGSMQLEARDSQTFMKYAGQAQIGGRIASVGQRLLDASARSIIRQSLDGLNEYLKTEVARQEAEKQAQQAQQAAQSSSAPTSPAAPTTRFVSAAAIPTYRPPSQTQLALNVARDVLNDLVPAPYQPIAAGVVIVLVLLLLRRIFSR